MKEGYSSDVEYKSIYINWDRESVLLTLYTSFHLLLFYSLLQRALGVIFLRPFLSRLKISAFVGGVATMYSLIYGWWCVFNYLNDLGNRSTRHRFLGSQLYLQTQEVFMIFCLALFVDNKADVGHRKLFLACMLAVATFHLLVDLREQYANVALVMLKPRLFWRTSLFLIADVYNLILALVYLQEAKYERKVQRVTAVFLCVFLITYYPLAIV